MLYHKFDMKNLKRTVEKFLHMLLHKFDMRKLKKKLKVSTFSCQICGEAFAKIFNSFPVKYVVK